MVVKALVAELAVETLDIGVLRRFARGDQLQVDAFAIGPAIHRAASELRSLIGTNGLRQSAKLCDAIQHARHVLAGDPEVHCNVQALSGEVIDDGQTLDATAAGERVHHEIDAPDLVGPPRQIERLAVSGDQLAPPALANAQLRLAVEPVDPLVIGLYAFAAQ